MYQNVPCTLPGQYFQQQIWSKGRTWRRTGHFNVLIFLHLSDELWQYHEGCMAATWQLGHSKSNRDSLFIQV